MTNAPSAINVTNINFFVFKLEPSPIERNSKYAAAEIMLGNGVVSAGVERIAAQYTPNRHERAL